VSLLADIVVVLILSTGVLILCHRLRIPTVLGYILTGILAGPSGLRLVAFSHQGETLAEVGVVMLLFTIGLEISFESLSRMKRLALGGGLLQVTATVLAAWGGFMLLGRTSGVALLWGLVLALSSTAIVLRTLDERGELAQPHGRAALGILIMQDLLVAPMLLLVPFLTGGLAGVTLSIGQSLIRPVLLLALVGAARWVVPWALHHIVRTRDRELFVIAVVAACLLIAFLTYKANLSLALGAFLAGLIISSSPFGHQALGAVLPLRHVFTSFFFISVGMLLDVPFALSSWTLVVPVTLAVILFKAAVVFLILILLRYPARMAIQAGLVLAQVGEFSFLVLKSAQDSALIGDVTYQLVLAVVLLSMVLTPFVIALAPRVARALTRGSGTRVRDVHGLPVPYAAYPEEWQIEGHLIIVGYGLVGRNLARAARSSGIPYFILEMNMDTVSEVGKTGEPIYYGDAIHDSVLKAVGTERARVLVVAIADPVAIRSITAAARRLNPALHLIVRTRYVTEIEPLRELGADEVIPEEFETSVEIFTRVLADYLVPQADIDAVATEIRSEEYRMLRSPTEGRHRIEALERTLPGTRIATLRVEEGCPLCGRTLAETDLRREHHVSVLALQRAGEIRANPPADEILRAGDQLVVLGAPESVTQVKTLFARA
jgi:CPA2 family monovalent cation:H+ antiporter-2